MACKIFDISVIDNQRIKNGLFRFFFQVLKKIPKIPFNFNREIFLPAREFGKYG